MNVWQAGKQREERKGVGNRVETKRKRTHGRSSRMSLDISYGVGGRDKRYVKRRMVAWGGAEVRGVGAVCKKYKVTESKRGWMPKGPREVEVNGRDT